MSNLNSMQISPLFALAFVDGVKRFLHFCCFFCWEWFSKKFYIFFSLLYYAPQLVGKTCAIFSTSDGSKTKTNGPFAASGHMVQNPPCWRASYALGHPKQRKFKFVLMKSLCSGCPSGQLALQHGGFCIMWPVHAFSHAWRRLHFASNSDWFVVLFVISLSNHFLFWLTTQFNCSKVKDVFEFAVGSRKPMTFATTMP